MHRAYQYRLSPTPDQEASLTRWAGCARAVYNAALEQRQDAWRMNRVSLSSSRQGGPDLTALKRSFAWLQEPHSDVLQQALRDLDRAFAAFFDGRARYPRFRRKGRERFRIQDRGRKGPIRVRRLSRHVGEVQIFKLGWVRFRWSREPVGRIRHLVVTRNARGWHVSLCCEREVAEPPAHSGPPLGVDRGVAATVALSTGELLSCPDLPPGQAVRLKRLERQAGRQETARRSACRRKSNRQRRVRAGIARLRAREARIRGDFLHKLSTDLAKSHGLVAIEDLRVKSMTRSARGDTDSPGINVAQKRGLNRAILAQGWGELERMLDYKLTERGGTLVKVPPAHTSQRCTACDTVDADSRHGRVFRCTACGHAADADVNAAQNILAAGLGRDSAGSPPGTSRGDEPRTDRRELADAA